MLTCDILDDIETEINKRVFALKNPENDIFSKELWKKGLSKLNSKNQIYLKKTYSFAKSLDYSHPGLSSTVYLAHPMRVAGIVLMLTNKDEQILLATVSLLHNVFEVTSIKHKKVESVVGPIAANYIRMLTINRDLQSNDEYLKSYYNEISKASNALAIVKVIDKLDNLFMLGLNPNESVKKRYLYEIETYILPLVGKHLPNLVDYFNKLVEYNKQNITLSL